MKHRGTQPIETPRLLLRRFLQGDAAAMYHNWAGDARVSRHMFWQPFASAEAVAEELAGWVAQYASPDFYRWAIQRKEDGALIGSIGLANFGTQGHPRWEPAYSIGHAFWGHGYTAEALCAVIEYFWDTGAQVLYAAHSVNNPASGRVLEKAGFVYRNQDAYQKPDGTLEPARYYRKKRPCPRHVGTRVVETPRLLLRRFEWGDAEAACGFTAAAPPGDAAEASRQVARWIDSYQRPDSYHWAIQRRQDGTLLGALHIQLCPAADAAEPCWQPDIAVAPAHRRKGYATEALQGALEAFVRCTGITCLCASPGANAAADALLRAAGFVPGPSHSGPGRYRYQPPGKKPTPQAKEGTPAWMKT